MKSSCSSLREQEMKECILRKYKLHEIRDRTISPVSLDTAVLLLLENVIFSGIGETRGWPKLYGGTFYKFSSRYSVTFAKVWPGEVSIIPPVPLSRLNFAFLKFKMLNRFQYPFVRDGTRWHQISNFIKDIRGDRFILSTWW